jgi:bacteriocin biosynthesis cyclodehydratase domain-containing protein
MRPTLLPNLRRLWRNAGTVQLGTDPATAVVLEFDEPSAARVLDLLDGTRTEHAITAEAAALGVDADTTRSVLDALTRAGVLVGAHTLLPVGLPDSARRRLISEAAALALRRDAHGRSPADTLRRRAAARVLVAGEGLLVAVIAAALGQAGIGHVDAAVDGWVHPEDAALGGLLHADAHRARSIATAEAVDRAAPGINLSRIRADAATFLVRVGARIPTALAARGYRTRGLPRLTVQVRDGVVLIGPLVRPSSSPCGRCLDLHRNDRDPAWPALAAQLETAPAERATCAVTTTLAAAAYATEEVLSYLDGRTPSTAGATVEVARPGQIRRRSWPPHPRCDCRRRRRI